MVAQPTPVGVEHVNGRTTYTVRGLTFTRPKDAIRAAEAFDRGITYTSPLRVTADDSTARHGGLRERGDASAVTRSGHPVASSRPGAGKDPPSRASGSPAER